MRWLTSRFDIDLRTPRVMGIVNVTPDSFSDGGLHHTTAAALRHCERLLQEGADILDIGGESSRPGSTPVALADELHRVLPVLKNALTLGVPISVDTYKPELMRAALDMGVDVINDISAFRHAHAIETVAAHPRCGLCLMHMHRDPQTMQNAPMTGDVVGQIVSFLRQRSTQLSAHGIAPERIVIDPGIGFGKTADQNFRLLAHQPSLLALGHPLLAAWSRKSCLGHATGQAVPTERIGSSIAAAVLSVERGARIVRVHDVRQTVDALKIWQASLPR